MRLLALLLLAPLMSGCISDHEATPATAKVLMDFAGFRPQDPQQLEHNVTFDASSPSTMSLYEESQRPPGYTAHDLVVDWADQTGTRIDVRHHAALGYVLQEVDGVVAHRGQGGAWVWALEVDGESTTDGISSVVVSEGSVYSWTFQYRPR